MNHLVLALTAAAFAVGVTPLVRALATRLGVVDRPGERRLHEAPVASLGGVAIFLAGLGAFLLAPLLGVPVVETLALHGWRLGRLLAGVLVVPFAAFLCRMEGDDGRRRVSPPVGCLLAGVVALYASILLPPDVRPAMESALPPLLGILVGASVLARVTRWRGLPAPPEPPADRR